MHTHKMDPYDYSSPPPAYNDQEFDRKTSLATEASLQQAPPPTEELSEERWAEIEEAAFQAAIAASLADAKARGVHTPSEGQSSRPIEPGPRSPSRSRSPASGSASPATVRQLATIKPLRIEKKGKTSVDLRNEKDKPKWLSEAESQALSSSSQAEPSAAGHSRHDSYDAPPPFVAVAPGGSEYSEPRYHDVGFDPPDCAVPPSAASSGTLPEFSQNSFIPTLDALSLSSLSSPASDYQPTAHPHQSPVNPLPQPPPHTNVRYQASPTPSNGHRQSMPTSPTQEPIAYRPELQRPRSFAPQPSSSYNPPSTPYNKGTMIAPMMPFNTSIAYGKTPFARLQTPPPTAMEEPRQEIVYRANAFYNAAVSAHLTPQTPQRSMASDQRSVHSNRSSSYNSSYGNSTASSPGYRNVTHMGMNPAQQHPYTAAPTPTDPNWGQPYPGNNRPVSIYSTDSGFSNSSVGQPQYLNTFQQVPQQHSGGAPSSWATAGSQQYQNSRYGQW